MNTIAENRSPETRPAREDYLAPEVNIFETTDGYVLQVEMPGVGKDGLQITLEGKEITIAGHRDAETKTGTALFRERRIAGYRRMFELDPAIDTGRITARMEQGVLTLSLPKSERGKPRKIAVD